MKKAEKAETSEVSATWSGGEALAVLRASHSLKARLLPSTVLHGANSGGVRAVADLDDSLDGCL